MLGEVAVLCGPDGSGFDERVNVDASRFGSVPVRFARTKREEAGAAAGDELATA